MFFFAFLACPPSTYKDYTGDAGACKSCPANSGHHLMGSASLSDCQCFSGYLGSPELSNPCISKSLIYRKSIIKISFSGLETNGSQLVTD